MFNYDGYRIIYLKEFAADIHKLFRPTRIIDNRGSVTFSRRAKERKPPAIQAVEVDSTSLLFKAQKCLHCIRI